MQGVVSITGRGELDMFEGWGVWNSRERIWWGSHSGAKCPQGLGASSELDSQMEEKGGGPSITRGAARKEKSSKMFSTENLIQGIYYLGRAEKTQGVVRQIRGE